MTKKTDFRKKLQDQIYTFHISLPDTDPLVWRRVLVPGIFTLEALHSVFQFAMGWQMSHLYDFKIDGKRYSDPDEFDRVPVKSVASTIAATVTDQMSFIYNYDFGDDWRHVVKVEEIAERKEGVNYPICIAGENACPPEDCHGVPGYSELKKIISSPKHPEHQEMMQWLGGYFDPKTFDPNRINRDMLWMIDWEDSPNDQGLYLPNFSEN